MNPTVNGSSSNGSINVNFFKDCFSDSSLNSNSRLGFTYGFLCVCFLAIIDAQYAVVTPRWKDCNSFGIFCDYFNSTLSALDCVVSFFWWQIRLPGNAYGGFGFVKVLRVSADCLHKTRICCSFNLIFCVAVMSLLQKNSESFDGMRGVVSKRPPRAPWGS